MALVLIRPEFLALPTRYLLDRVCSLSLCSGHLEQVMALVLLALFV